MANLELFGQIITKHATLSDMDNRFAVLRIPEIPRRHEMDRVKLSDNALFVRPYGY